MKSFAHAFACMLVGILFASAAHAAPPAKAKYPKSRAPAEDGADAGAAPPPLNCDVDVISVRRSGESEERHFYSYTPTRAGCDKDAELHRINFAPQAIAEKTVTFRWNGQ